MALGASTGSVIRLVLGRVSILLVIGTAIGFAIILSVGTFIDALLFRVQSRDPVTLGVSAALLIVVGLFAAWLPARRVSRLHPTTALRQ